MVKSSCVYAVGSENLHRSKKTYLEVPGIEPGASYMQSKRSTAELHPHRAKSRVYGLSNSRLIKKSSIESIYTSANT